MQITGAFQFPVAYMNKTTVLFNKESSLGCTVEDWNRARTEDAGGALGQLRIQERASPRVPAYQE